MYMIDISYRYVTSDDDDVVLSTSAIVNRSRTNKYAVFDSIFSLLIGGKSKAD